jgi:hypothetical protein
MFLIAVSRNGVFLGTILFKGVGGDISFSGDCEGPVFPDEILQRIASCLKDGKPEGRVDGYEWNVQDLESLIWRPIPH